MLTEVDKQVSSKSMKRFRAVITMLGVYLQEHHLVASGEKHFDPRDKSQLDPRNELTLEYSEFLWKIGRLNTFQDIYFSLLIVTGKDAIQLFNSSYGTKPNPAHLDAMNRALPGLVQGLVDYYPVLEEECGDILDMIRY